jgi:hypothetical protein
MFTSIGREAESCAESGMPQGAAVPAIDRPRSRWTEWLVLAGFAACAAGFVAERTFAELSWPRLVDLVAYSALSLAFAWPIRRWLGISWAAALVAVWLAAAIAFCGIRSCAAASLIAAAGIAIGSCVVPASARFRGTLALPVGLALLGGIDGWLLPFPVHRFAYYLPLLLGVCWWRRAALRAIAIDAARDFRRAIAAAPALAAFAVVAVGLASTGTWLPTMQFDDLAYHLALPSQLLRHGTYAFEPAHQIWTLAPWLADVLQGIAEVVAGRESRGAVNAIWIVLAASSSWSLVAAMQADARTSWLAVALLASQPLVASLAAGMQTELATSALAISMALAILREEDFPFVSARAVLAGGLVGLKFGALAIAAILLGWSLVRTRRRAYPRAIAIGWLLFAIVAGSNYFYATGVSGNPFLPLFNDVFHSDVLPPRQLDDLRWHAGFAATLPWSITFATDRYFECWKGGFGFALVALAGAWLLALFAPRTRAIAIAATLAFALPLVPIQYARYAFPGLALLLPVMLVSARAALGARKTMIVVLALCVLDFSFQANANGLLQSSARRQIVKGADREDVFGQFAPERALIGILRARDGGDSIVLALDPGEPAIAELAGRGRCVAWYDPELNRQRVLADADATGEGWRHLIVGAQARWLLLRPGEMTAALRNGIDLVRAERAATAGPAELWLVPDERLSAKGKAP